MRRLGLLILFLGVPVIAVTVRADTLIEAPSVAGDSYNSNVLPVTEAVNVYRGLGGDNRAILEFDLRQLPAGAMISSANLTVTILESSDAGGNGPVIGLYGYAGNNALDSSDGIQTNNLLTSFNAAVTGIDQSFDETLPAVYVQSLVSSSTPALGILAYQETPNATAFLDTDNTDGSRFGGDTTPMLQLTYSVPEPIVPNFVFLSCLLIIPRRWQRE